ncbi:MAG TPA: hypothetical protein VMM36_13290 [Opitutaceae bacterium]|nr:hypothetical protein [Opitutaceae bacterium]
MKVKLLFLAVLAFSPCLVTANVIRVGMSESELMQRWGKADSALTARGKTVYYWSGLDVTVVDGKVESFRFTDASRKRAQEAERIAQARIAKRKADEAKRIAARTRRSSAQSEEAQLRAKIDKGKPSAVERERVIKSMEDRIRSKEEYLARNYRPGAWTDNKFDFHLTEDQYRLGKLEIERMKKELEAYKAKHLSE